MLNRTWGPPSWPGNAERHSGQNLSQVRAQRGEDFFDIFAALFGRRIRRAQVVADVAFEHLVHEPGDGTAHGGGGIRRR